MIELIGYIGAALLAGCAIPEVYVAVTTGNVGLSWGFLGLWYVGEICAMIYVIGKSKKVKLIPLLFNYGVNIVLISALIYYKGI